MSWRLARKAAQTRFVLHTLGPPRREPGRSCGNRQVTASGSPCPVGLSAVSTLLAAGSVGGGGSTVATCAGACGDLLNDAIAQKVDLYLTGEMRHHDAIKAAAAGMTVVCTLHSNSERATLKRLKERLEKELPGLEYHLSRTDRDPFAVR